MSFIGASQGSTPSCHHEYVVGALAAVVWLFARESKRLGTGGFGFASLRMLANLSGPQPTPTSESSRPCQRKR